MDEKQRRGRYTPEFRQEAVRQVKAGRSAAAVAQTLGIPKASLTNWVRADKRGKPTTGSRESSLAVRSVTPEQAEIAQLRAEVARLRMERDIAKKAAAYFAQDVLQSTPGFKR